MELEAQGCLDHPDGNSEVTLTVGMSDSVRIGLPVGGVAVVAPGTDVDFGTTVGSTGDVGVVGDVLHNEFSFIY